MPKVLQNILIEKMSHDCRGIARIDGKTVFLSCGLTQEIVDIKITRKHKKFSEGVVLEVIKGSELRVEPPCEYAKNCGGCTLQHLAYDEQILLKEKILKELLTHKLALNKVKFLKPYHDKAYDYRHKARLSVKFIEKENNLLIGFRDKFQPDFIVDIKKCNNLTPKIDLQSLRKTILKLAQKKHISQIEIAAGDSDLALIIRNLQPLPVADLEILKEYALKYAYKIFLQPACENSVYSITKGDELLSYSLPEFAITNYFYPTDFTQINLAVNRYLVSLAVKLLDIHKADKILDLFCGLGNFSLPFAKYCAKLTGIEGCEKMVKRAKSNALQNGITNANFIAANLDCDLELSQEYNKLLLDPPRLGAYKIVMNIEKINPQIILYISCNPITLARDAEVLVKQKKYKLNTLGVIDMFPNTAHVESIALFTKS